jgi:hypothetical protein
MLTKKIEKEKQDELKKNIITELEKWENEQLDIFSDIIISILLQPNSNFFEDE